MSGRFPYFWAVYKKELRSYFDTPTAYVVAVVMLLIGGYLFASPLFIQNQADVSGFVETAPLLFTFFIPAVTMRLYAEEYRSGTIEILSALPVKDAETLLAKYAGALTMISFILAPTTAYAASVILLGRPDLGGLLGSYLGLWLTAALLASVGLWASSLTRNQIVAFIAAFLVGFAFFLVGKVHLFVPPSWAFAADFLGLDSHLDNISRGVIDTRDLLYYLCLSGFFLYAAYLKVARRRGR